MKYEIHPALDKLLSKLAKRDKFHGALVLKKIDEIAQGQDIDHYRNLRAPLQRYKRVHVYSSFVLLFRLEKDTIIFRTYDHHDEIYLFSDA